VAESGFFTMHLPRKYGTDCASGRSPCSVCSISEDTYRSALCRYSNRLLMRGHILRLPVPDRKHQRSLLVTKDFLSLIHIASFLHTLSTLGQDPR
jgi:hypothetical protein